MDYKEELQRIKEVLDDMSMEEFEKMMFDCGLGTILPSGESEFVESLL